MTPQKIELIPAPEKSKRGDWNLYPGRKAIMVDGVLYGYALMRRRGTHGAVYWFEQAGGGRITETTLIGVKKHERRFDVEVWGDKVAMRRWNIHDGTPRPGPLKDRLLAMAKQLVDEKKLIPETAQRKRDEAETARQAAQITAREKREAAAWRKRAAACLPGGELPDPVESERAISKIVEAMKWAQSQ